MERHWDAASQGEKPAPATDAVVVSRQSFCDYLVSARKQRGRSVLDIATVTRIPVRSLERLESGLFEELPADVFVRGFLRSYARCVGLNAEETIRRYTDCCGMTPAPVCSPMAGEAGGEIERRLASESRAVSAAVVVEAGDEVRPVPSARSRTRHGAEYEQLERETRAEQAIPADLKSAARVEVVDLSARSDESSDAGDTGDASDEQPRRKRRRRRRKQRRDGVEASAAQPGQAQAHVEPAPGPVPAESALQAAPAVEGAQTPASATAAERVMRPSTAVVVSEGEPQPLTGRVRAPTQSARPQLAGRVRASTVTARPVLIIDDEHPEYAERSQEERVERSDASWRSFLPPSLLDSDDGSHRGTLTLAVIILVIVATLTMSYLLRRPNVSGDGVTWRGPTPGEMTSRRAHA